MLQAADHGRPAEASPAGKAGTVQEKTTLADGSVPDNTPEILHEVPPASPLQPLQGNNIKPVTAAASKMSWSSSSSRSSAQSSGDGHDGPSAPRRSAREKMRVLAVGERVLARGRKNGAPCTFSGRIVAKRPDGTFDVAFSDGEWVTGLQPSRLKLRDAATAMAGPTTRRGGGGSGGGGAAAPAHIASAPSAPAHAAAPAHTAPTAPAPTLTANAIAPRDPAPEVALDAPPLVARRSARDAAGKAPKRLVSSTWGSVAASLWRADRSPLKAKRDREDSGPVLGTPGDGSCGGSGSDGAESGGARSAQSVEVEVEVASSPGSADGANSDRSVLSAEVEVEVEAQADVAADDDHEKEHAAVGSGALVAAAPHAVSPSAGRECGRCINCRDKPKFGGMGTRKQRCIQLADAPKRRRVSRKAVPLPTAPDAPPPVRPLKAADVIPAHAARAAAARVAMEVCGGDESPRGMATPAVAAMLLGLKEWHDDDDDDVPEPMGM